MKKWLVGAFALVAGCASAPVLDASQTAQTAPTAQTAQAAQPPVVAPLSREFQPKPYTVGPGDTIQLDFYNLSETDVDMKGVYLVEASGSIQLKYVGSIAVNHLTTPEIEDAVEKALIAKNIYLPDVIAVTARVTIERQQPVNLQGYVVSPGEKQLRGSQMTVSRAINAAGGFTSTAGQEVEVHRKVGGTTQIIKVTRTMLNVGDDPGLIADDTVVVKQGYVFFVNGQVLTPGLKVWEPEMTVLKAIGLAGGMTPKGKLGHIERPIKDADGKILKYEKIKNLKPEMAILPDDVLFIALKWFG